MFFMSTISSISEFLRVSFSTQHMTFYILFLLYVLGGDMEGDSENACSRSGFDICSMAFN